MKFTKADVMAIEAFMILEADVSQQRPSLPQSGCHSRLLPPGSARHPSPENHGARRRDDQSVEHLRLHPCGDVGGIGDHEPRQKTRSPAGREPRRSSATARGSTRNVDTLKHAQVSAKR